MGRFHKTGIVTGRQEGGREKNGFKIGRKFQTKHKMKEVLL